MVEKPLSPRPKRKMMPRRAREFRDRWLKRHLGDRKRRTERYARLRKEYGKDTADTLSARCYSPKPDRSGLTTHYGGILSTEGS